MGYDTVKMAVNWFSQHVFKESYRRWWQQSGGEAPAAAGAQRQWSPVGELLLMDHR